MRMARGAGVLRRAGVDRDDEGAGIEGGLGHRQHDVGEVDAGQDADLVALDHAGRLDPLLAVA